jgi:Dolichyl-phosphate-mannose-protein mannosyltransferase
VIADAKSRSRRPAALARVRGWTASADTTLVIAAVALGSAIRITQYVTNRSLWLDESALALNVIDRSAGALLGPLAFAQAAPPGFLLVEKGLTHIFGRGEYALRLFPLLASLAALLLFALLARRVLGRWTAALAVLLFASAGNLIYYGSEVKQYSGDVAATLVLLLIGVFLYEKPVRGRRTTVVFAAAGCAVLFISYAAVFPAVGVAVVLAGLELARRPRRITSPLAVAIVWGLASLLVVLFSRNTTGSVRFAFQVSSSAYIGSSSSDFLSSLREPPSALARDAGFLPLPSPLYWAFVLLALVGLIGLARRRTAYAGFFVGAPLLTLIASALHRYPIADRTILFLVPIAILFVAEGSTVVAGFLRQVFGGRARLAAVLALAVLAVPGWRALTVLVHPQKREEIKAAIAVIRSDWRTGDTLYVSSSTQFALRYYLECNCLDVPRWPFGRTNAGNSQQNVPLRSRPPHFIAGHAPLGGRASYLTDVRKLVGRRRVWLLYSHAGTPDELTYLRGELPRRLAAFGRLRRTFIAPGVTLFLYDLRAR